MNHKSLKNKIKYLLGNLVLLSVITLMTSSVHAFGGLAEASSAVGKDMIGENNYHIHGLDNNSSNNNGLSTTSGLPERFGFSHDFAQSQKQRFKSRSEVMSEVKRRYDAKILKITLDRAREVYVVRLLMLNGKVKTVQVSARA